MAFTCPRCERASQHPEDARQGYCGACRDWTGLTHGVARGFMVTGPGGFARQLVTGSPARAGDAVRYVRETYGTRLGGLGIEVRGFLTDPNTLADLVTSWSRDPGVIADSAAGNQPEVDEYPWIDSATWHSGDGESK